MGLKCVFAEFFYSLNFRPCFYHETKNFFRRGKLPPLPSHICKFPSPGKVAPFPIPYLQIPVDATSIFVFRTWEAFPYSAGYFVAPFVVVQHFLGATPPTKWRDHEVYGKQSYVERE